MDKLTADAFRMMARASAARLEAEKARVDALNVFPVPDGDTGTNMALTLWAAANAVLKHEGGGLGELAEVAAKGALMGARGNSGVILSQFLRGFADAVKGYDEIDAGQLAKALKQAADAAYGAVVRPVEGTVLTVGKEAARQAMKIAEAGGNLLEVLDGSLAAAMKTLAQTPELLAALKEAGVVDAGGEGLVVAATGALSAINGKMDDAALREIKEPDLGPEPEPETEPAPPGREAQAKAESVAGGISEATPQYRYCTEFLLKGEQLDKPAIEKALADLGDSMLVVGEPTLLKIHIHTNHPGLVLELCGSRGELSAIHINNMAEQNIEAARKARPSEAPAAGPAENRTEETGRVGAGTGADDKPKEPVELAVVSVTSGSGCIELLKNLGVAEVVQGGQTMNPSTEQILSAIEKANAKAVIVLPNNGNVLMTARQAAHLASIPVTVIPSRSFCEGVAAMLQFSPKEPLADNVKRMEEALSTIASGEVTVAVRDARVDGHNIVKGSHLGISRGRIISSGDDRTQVIKELVAAMMKEKGGTLVTFYIGADTPEEEAAAIAAELTAAYGVEVEIYQGLQPVYSYLISVE
ncbi:MAG TPA: DAK2 domain-containing protein [Firmicutes bacterium]|nr:DAK2 domain-containing protein [Bacillota bacterium]